MSYIEKSFITGVICAVIKLTSKKQVVADRYYNVEHGEFYNSVDNGTHFVCVEFAQSVADVMKEDDPDLNLSVEETRIEYHKGEIPPQTRFGS
jgi:hypothetical protein